MCIIGPRLFTGVGRWTLDVGRWLLVGSSREEELGMAAGGRRDAHE
jgi:hypothetical protein